MRRFVSFLLPLHLAACTGAPAATGLPATGLPATTAPPVAGQMRIYTLAPKAFDDATVLAKARAIGMPAPTLSREGERLIATQGTRVLAADPAREEWDYRDTGALPTPPAAAAPLPDEAEAARLAMAHVAAFGWSDGDIPLVRAFGSAGGAEGDGPLVLFERTVDLVRVVDGTPVLAFGSSITVHVGRGGRIAGTTANWSTLIPGPLVAVLDEAAARAAAPARLAYTTGLNGPGYVASGFAPTAAELRYVTGIAPRTIVPTWHLDGDATVDGRIVQPFGVMIAGNPAYPVSEPWLPIPKPTP